jgi:urea transport system ATP-binding protein
MLSVQRIEAGYGESIILRDVSIRVESGQVVCLLGRNGVGKTTLIKSIIGLLKTVKGAIRYNEADLTRKSPSERARNGIGYVPQGREVFPQLSVYDNILLGLEASWEKPKPTIIPPEAVDKFPILPEIYGRPPFHHGRFLFVKNQH